MENICKTAARDAKRMWKSKNEPHSNKLCQKFWLWHSNKNWNYRGSSMTLNLSHCVNARTCIWMPGIVCLVFCWCMFFRLRSLKHKTFARDIIKAVMHSMLAVHTHMAGMLYCMCICIYICALPVCRVCLCIFGTRFALLLNWWNCMESAFPIRSEIFPVHMYYTILTLAVLSVRFKLG